MIKLVAIQCDGSLAEEGGPLSEVVRSVIEPTVRLSEPIGWNFPWVGYLAFEDGVCAGTRAFKGAPKDDAVEIAYHSFPGPRGPRSRNTEWQSVFVQS